MLITHERRRLLETHMKDRADSSPLLVNTELVCGRFHRLKALALFVAVVCVLTR